jgi:hypothetical protein
VIRTIQGTALCLAVTVGGAAALIDIDPKARGIGVLVAVAAWLILARWTHS